MKTGRPAINIAGQMFGELTAIEPCGRTENGFILWRVRCTCGKVETRLTGQLRHNKAKRCRECARHVPKNRSHGYTCNGKVPPEYKSWYSMKDRCLNPCSR